MNAKHFLLTAFLLGSVSPVLAQRTERTNYKFDFTGAKPSADVIAVNGQTLFTDAQGYGYDLQPAWDGKSSAPFFFSVNVPDGNYRVTVTLGSKRRAGETTVRAESRRLFIENLPTAKGKTLTQTFIVNKRNTSIEGGDKVKIKPREANKLNWDDKLTLEFNGDAPCVQRIEIEKVDDATTIYLCGNSTVVDQDNEPWASWGQILPRFFDDKVAIANYAESGERATTFIAANRLKKILSIIKPGDYLVVEFGHNDEKDKGVGSGAYFSYMTTLKKFVDEARKRGANPVLVTPTQRRFFGKDGRLRNTHGEFPDAMRFLAKHDSVPLIDLNAQTTVLYETLGEEGSKKAFVHYPAGSYPGQTKEFADNTHFNPYGAYQLAQIILNGMESLRLPVAQHIKDFKGYSPAHPDPVATFKWNDSPFTEIQKPDGN